MEYLLSEWVRKFHQPGLLKDGDKVYAVYVARVSLSCSLWSFVRFHLLDMHTYMWLVVHIQLCIPLPYRYLLNSTALSGDDLGIQDGWLASPFPHTLAKSTKGLGPIFHSTAFFSYSQRFLNSWLACPFPHLFAKSTRNSGLLHYEIRIVGDLSCPAHFATR